jgi:16S rRNA (cytidine1402-2'-O)-methyltransferase
LAKKLFVVATPIGNLEDITLRALRILKEVDIIAAEDTRQTRKLLNHFVVKTPLTSYHEYNEKARGAELVKKMLLGKSVALVSDAGTPAISDPGFTLVNLAIKEGIEVVSVPGASALVSALSISGLDITEFTFLGFLPSKAGERKKLLEGLTKKEGTYAVYESPRRLVKTLCTIYDILGDIQVVVAREMTKMHEEVVRGKVSEVIKAFETNGVKGEIVLIFRTQPRVATLEEAIIGLKSFLKDGLSVSEAAKRAAKEFDMKKSVLYSEALKLKKK